MKTYRKWLYRALLILIIVIGSVGAANYVGDPYGIFRSDFSFQFIEPNGNFIKTRYVSKHADAYDCIIFGSSRVGRLDPKKIEGLACYNMNSSGAIPRDHLNNLRFFLKKGMKPKLLLLGLDEYDYTVDPKEYLVQPLRYPYPPTIHEKLLPFYLKYLFSLFSKEIWQPVWDGHLLKWRSGHLWGKGKEGYEEILQTGYLPNTNEDNYIDNNPAAHEKKMSMLPPFAMPTTNEEGAYMEGALTDLQNIVDISKAKGIRLILFINPIHKTTYLSKNLGKFLEFRKRLSKITDYWDFSGLNSITTSNYYYYEPSHYRVNVGNMMLSRMLGSPKVSFPSDFGVYVTPQRIEAHLKKLEEEVRKN